MSALRFVACLAIAAAPILAQPAFEGPVPSTAVVENADSRRAAYHDRIDQVLTWRVGLLKPTDALLPDMGAIAAKLARRQDAEQCSRSAIALVKEPGTGPFWMFPVVGVAHLGRDLLSAEARQAIRHAWRSQMQVRGDTENHWVMYYASLYLMSELYPDEPGSSWYSGKSSAENLAEARDYLIHWMELTTAIGQGEFTCSHYIGEFAIPMLYLCAWAKDPAMRQRGHMMLDWLFADQFASSLNGVLTGANARTDDAAVIERWNCLSSFFSWLLLGNTPPPASFGGFGIYFAAAARHYELPEVIYRIGVDRDGDVLQRDLKRTRRRWRNSDVTMAPIYKQSYSRRDYAVGSYQGGMADPIQTHTWDVTWAVPDPRGKHCTMFSMHPVSSAFDLQAYFTEFPDHMMAGVTRQGKASYDSPDKLLGGSRFEQVFQDQDTVIALYDIPPGTRFPHINGFISKDLTNVTVDPSGWIFAQGGNAYLAYRPLAGYELLPFAPVKSSWTGERAASGDRRLYSPHRKNGTIVQAASATEHRDFDAFKAAINALPLEHRLEPSPTVSLTTLRGKRVVVAYGQPPQVDGRVVDYSQWQLFEGPYLNAARHSHRLTLSHGRLRRVLDFETLTITDSVAR